MYYSAKKREALPWLISWQNKDYPVGKLGYYHKVKKGDTLHHIFELVDRENTLWFRLNLDTGGEVEDTISGRLLHNPFKGRRAGLFGCFSP